MYISKRRKKCIVREVHFSKLKPRLKCFYSIICQLTRQEMLMNNWPKHSKHFFTKMIPEGVDITSS